MTIPSPDNGVAHFLQLSKSHNAELVKALKTEANALVTVTSITNPEDDDEVEFQFSCQAKDEVFIFFVIEFVTKAWTSGLPVMIIFQLKLI